MAVAASASAGPGMLDYYSRGGGRGFWRGRGGHGGGGYGGHHGAGRRGRGVQCVGTACSIFHISGMFIDTV